MSRKGRTLLALLMFAATAQGVSAADIEQSVTHVCAAASPLWNVR